MPQTMESQNKPTDPQEREKSGNVLNDAIETVFNPGSKYKDEKITQANLEDTPQEHDEEKEGQ